MTEHQVIIVGAGPTGLMLAGELKLAGIDVIVLERRANQDIVGHRARGFHARTIEVLDQRGIAGRFLAEGQKAQVAGFAGVRLDLSGFPTRHDYGLALGQKAFERILAGWVDELGVLIQRGVEVTGFSEDDAGIGVTLADERTVRGLYLVGCDGGRSLVRKTAGIGFPGSDATISNLIAEAELRDPPPLGIRHDAIGIHAITPAEGGRFGLLVTERQIGRGADPTLADLSAALVAHYGTDFGIHGPSWISRFTDAARQAEHYRKGRVLLAGDAAHVHYPVGGQGLGVGIQDAVNLGWKLAEVVKGAAPESLLDTYHSERHKAATRVLGDTMAQVALGRQDNRSKAARDIVVELLGMDEPKKRFAARMAGLDIRYDFGDGHPLLGRRMPDLDLTTASGPVTVYSLLHTARPVFLNFGAAARFDLSSWADRVQVIDAGYAGPWELPGIGAVEAPAAVLVRPDGYVAWVGEGTEAGLVEALTKWFGPAQGS